MSGREWSHKTLVLQAVSWETLFNLPVNQNKANASNMKEPG